MFSNGNDSNQSMVCQVCTPGLLFKGSLSMVPVKFLQKGIPPLTKMSNCDLRIMFFMTYIRNTQTKARVISGSYKPVTIYSKWIWVFFVSAWTSPFSYIFREATSFGMIIPTHGSTMGTSSTERLFREIAPNLSKNYFRIKAMWPSEWFQQFPNRSIFLIDPIRAVVIPRFQQGARTASQNEALRTHRRKSWASLGVFGRSNIPAAPNLSLIYWDLCHLHGFSMF